MYCQYCGKELMDNEACNCPGAASQQQTQPQQGQQYQQPNGQQQYQPANEEQNSQQQYQQSGQDGQQQYQAPPQQNNQQYQQQPQSGPVNGMAIGSFIVSILALVFAFIPFMTIIGLILSILAVVFSSIASRQIAENGGGGKGFAVAGMVIGIILLIINLIGVIFMASCLGMVSSCLPYSLMY